MDKVVSAEIAPDGSLVGEPTTREERFLWARYDSAMLGETRVPRGAMSLFTMEAGTGNACSGAPNTAYEAFDIHREGFEQESLFLSSGIGLYEAINREALSELWRACSERATVPVSGIPGFLLGRSSACTHLLLCPQDYRECAGAMGWDTDPDREDPVRSFHLGRSSRRCRLGVRDITVATGATTGHHTALCVKASSLKLVMERGSASYSYGKEEFEIRRQYSFLHDARGVEIIMQ